LLLYHALIQPIGGAAKQSALAEPGQSFARMANSTSRVRRILDLKEQR
jgi:hypothetical protein